MRHVYFETMEISGGTLENFIDPPYVKPGIAVPWDSQIFTVSGVFVHRNLSVVAVQLENNDGRKCTNTRIALPSFGVGDRHPDIKRCQYARYSITGIPVHFLIGGATIVAVTEDGHRHHIASARFIDVLGFLTGQDRMPTKLSSLRLLRDSGLKVGTVIDIGVQHHTRELIEIFPDKKHVLFEPVSENYDKIRANYAKIDFDLIQAAASDRNGEGLLALRTHPGSHVFTSSLVTEHENQIDFLTVVDERRVSETTVDSALRERACDKPFLLKLDVDGNEPRVLSGATETLKETSCVIIESSLAELFERGAFLKNAGFILWDIVDLGYYRNNLFHADLIFLSPEEKQRSFSPWREVFDPTKIARFLH